MTSRISLSLAAAVLSAAIAHLGAVSPQAPGGTAPPPLPDGPGKEIVMRVCLECHALPDIAKRRESRREWAHIIGEMLDKGAPLTTEEVDVVVSYTSANLGKHIKINEAAAKDIADTFDITSDAATAIVKYRDEHGKFKTWQDLTKVPGIDAKRVEEQKDNLEFGS